MELAVEPLTISIQSTTAVLNLGRTSVFRLIREQKLEVVRIGRRTLVKTQSIRDLVDQTNDSIHE